VKNLILALLLCAGCQKNENKLPPRCIYDQTVFAEMALHAVNDEALFLQFKKDPFFNLLWENHSPEEGEQWLSKIQIDYPSLLEKLSQFRQNDEWGSPRVHSFEGAGDFSPSTLRLIAIAGDMQNKMGDMSGLNIVQIGAGFGGMCKILHDIASFKSYTIVDLPEQLALAKKYLERLGIDNVTYLTPEELVHTECDLVISDRSFSEFNRSYQARFIEKIFIRSHSGYILGHVFPKHFGVSPLFWDDLKMRVKKIGKFSEWQIQEPLNDRDNYFIFWKR
jgi:hypothetical protein